MFCPQCGAQTEQSTKFCKSCGLKLADHARLLEEPREAERMSEVQWLREKRLLTGVIMTLVSVFDLVLFFIIFGTVALSNLGNPAFHKSGLITLLVFLFASLLTAGIGVGNLIASGFFRNMRERQLRIELGLLEQRRRALESESPKPQTAPHTRGREFGRHGTHDARTATNPDHQSKIIRRVIIPCVELLAM